MMNQPYMQQKKYQQQMPPHMPGMNPNMNPNMYFFNFQQEMAPPNMIGQNMFAPKNQNQFALYVGNLEKDVTDRDLVEHFKAYTNNSLPPLVHIRSKHSDKTGKRNNFAFVSFSTEEERKKARKESDFVRLKNKKPMNLRISCNDHQNKVGDPELNVFLSNLNSQQINGLKLENVLEELFGEIYSIKIGHNEEGINFNYGYVCFDKKESANNCIDLIAKSYPAKLESLQPEKIMASKFLPREKRLGEDKKQNLFLKGFPQNIAPADLEKSIIDFFSTYGKIKSVKAISGNGNAFVCFEDPNDAKKALDNENKKDFLKCGQPIEIEYAESRSKRISKFKEKYNTPEYRESNLVLNNLLTTVTAENLKNEFAKFGKIEKYGIKTTKNSKYPDTTTGYIKFSSKEEANKTLTEAKSDINIKKMFKEEKALITIFLPKEERERIKGKKNMPNLNFPRPQVMMPPFPHQQQPNFQMPPNQYLYHVQPNMHKKPMNLPAFKGGNPHNKGGYQNKRNMQKKNPHFIDKSQMMQNQENIVQQQQQMYVQNQPERNEIPQIQPQNIPQHNEIPLDTFPNIESIKTNLNDFNNLPSDKKRNILGEMIYPQIEKELNTNKQQYQGFAGKIAGMLIDLDVFEINDIIEMIENTHELSERIDEAISLLQKKEEQEDPDQNEPPQ